MSSPGARQRRRREQYQAPRKRAELTIAIGVGVAIVLGTALMIWLLRPGGLADRQPRSSWLIAIALTAAISAAATILRPNRRRELNRPLWLGGSLGAIVVVAVLAGVLWPSGLLRHTPKAITVPTTPTVTAATTLPTATTTAAGASTTAPGSTATTQPTTATTAPTVTTTPTSTSSP